MVDFLWQPSALGLSDDVSNGCGTPDFVLSLKPNLLGSSFIASPMFCKDTSAEALVSAWSKHVENIVAPKIPYVKTNLKVLQNMLAILYDMPTYPEFVIASNEYMHLRPVPKGHVPDNPTITVGPDSEGSWCAAVPIDWVLQKGNATDDEVYYYLKNVLGGSHLMGGRAAIAHDGTTALPAQVRTAALEQNIPNQNNYSNAMRIR